jgi:AraC-like DNA-binding protein
MKAQHAFGPHLVFNKVVLPPGGEWAPNSPGWSVMQVNDGVGYWLHPRINRDLPTGAVLLLSDRMRGAIRASQLGPVSMDYFVVHPERLTGLTTIGEQQYLEAAAAQEVFSFRLVPPPDPLAQKFKDLACGQSGAGLLLRLGMIELFLECFGREFNVRGQAMTQEVPDAKARLEQLLSHLTASELVELDFARLVEQMGCTPRHLSRTFRAVVGMSFREKQTELRLLRARELLASTRSKVLEVALESGYESLSLFNLMFKRRFGLSPGKWRQQMQARETHRRCAAPRLQLAPK